jgi:hypothetical protein
MMNLVQFSLIIGPLLITMPSRNVLGIKMNQGDLGVVKVMDI